MTLHSRDVTARVAFNTNYFEGFIYLYIYIYSDPLHTLLQAFIVRPWPLFGSQIDDFPSGIDGFINK